MSRLSRWLRTRELLPAKGRAVPQPSMDGIGRHRLAPPLACEVDAAPADREALFDHIAARWSWLGESEPYWSVLSHPRYRSDVFARHEEEFFADAHGGAAVIEAIFARNGESFSTLTRCLELGCGVGRSTRSLARLFPQVVAVDVSPAHLALARDHLARAGLDNVSWHQVRAIEDLDELPRFDLLFSEFVLEHDAPPVIAAMLEGVLPTLQPGVYCLFRLPT